MASASEVRTSNTRSGMASRFHLVTPGLPCIFINSGPLSSTGIWAPSYENATLVSFPVMTDMDTPLIVLSLPMLDLATISFTF